MRLQKKGLITCDYKKSSIGTKKKGDWKKTLSEGKKKKIREWRWGKNQNNRGRGVWFGEAIRMLVGRGRGGKEERVSRWVQGAARTKGPKKLGENVGITILAYTAQRGKEGLGEEAGAKPRKAFAKVRKKNWQKKKRQVGGTTGRRTPGNLPKEKRGGGSGKKREKGGTRNTPKGQIKGPRSGNR